MTFSNEDDSLASNRPKNKYRRTLEIPLVFWFITHAARQNFLFILVENFYIRMGWLKNSFLEVIE